MVSWYLPHGSQNYEKQIMVIRLKKPRSMGSKRKSSVITINIGLSVVTSNGHTGESDGWMLQSSESWRSS